MWNTSIIATITSNSVTLFMRNSVITLVFQNYISSKNKSWETRHNHNISQNWTIKRTIKTFTIATTTWTIRLINIKNSILESLPLFKSLEIGKMRSFIFTVNSKRCKRFVFWRRKPSNIRHVSQTLLPSDCIFQTISLNSFLLISLSLP